MNRDDIIDNIGSYTAQEIVDFLIQGEITIEEVLRENPENFSKPLRSETENLLWEKASNKRELKLVNCYLLNYPEGKFVDRAKSLRQELETVKPASPKPREELIEMPVSSHDPWVNVDKDSIDSLRSYIDSYPKGAHIREARQLINTLIETTDLPRGPEWLKSTVSQIPYDATSDIVKNIEDAFNNERIEIYELMDLIEENNNFVSLKVIKTLLDDGYISFDDFRNSNLDADFLLLLKNRSSKLTNEINVEDLENPSRINQVCQEVYFWGMPSSGKTCALGAILSAAGTGVVAKAIEKNPDCNGIEYMRQLSEVFKPNKISILPTRTEANFVSDMSFWLLDQKNKLHSITLIDLAGEMLEAMYLVERKKFDYLSPEQEEGYKCIKNLLVDDMSSNSKIHFFVIEYGGHERKEKDISQADLLDIALRHVKKLGILKNTDGVFILLTKADIAFDEAEKRGEDVNTILKEYIINHYQSFYNTLKLNTEKINNGKIEIIPFSIGKVCFRDLCRFDDSAANEVVQLFLDRTPGVRTGKIGKLIKGMIK